MKIYVKQLMQEGKPLPLDVQPTDLIEIVKLKIQDKIGIPPVNQKLLLLSPFQELDIDRPISDYVIPKESTWALTLRLSGGAAIDNIKSEMEIFFSKNKKDKKLINDNISIYINVFQGNSFNLEVNPRDTIEIIKLKIFEKERIMPEHQNLIFEKKEMEDYKKLSDYNVKKESNLLLVKWIKTIEPDPEYGTFYTVKYDEFQYYFNFSLYIRILTGKFIILNMNGIDTIKNIKEKIQEKEGIPIVQQLLFFSGQVLEDNRSIALLVIE